MIAASDPILIEHSGIQANLVRDGDAWDLCDFDFETVHTSFPGGISEEAAVERAKLWMEGFGAGQLAGYRRGDAGAKAAVRRALGL